MDGRFKVSKSRVEELPGLDFVRSYTKPGESLVYVDRCLILEGSSHAFDSLREKHRSVYRPRQVFAFSDHYVPTRGQERGVDAIPDPEIRNMVVALRENTSAHGIGFFGMGHERQGILHIVPPELGITQPGMLLVCGDSHTSTHGAFGALAHGIGTSEVEHVMATQTLVLRKAKNMYYSFYAPDFSGKVELIYRAPRGDMVPFRAH